MEIGSLGEISRLAAVAEVLRHLRDPLLLASRSGQILFANIAGAEALAASAPALEGAPLSDWAPDVASLQAALDGRSQLPFPVNAKDGRRFVCAPQWLDGDTLLLRLSGGPDDATRKRVFLEALQGGGFEEAGGSRLERLHAFTRMLARAFTTVEVAEAVVDMGLAATAARGGGLWLRSADGATVCLARAVGEDVPRPEQFVHVPLDRVARMPILDAIRDEAPVWVESCGQMALRYPEAFRAFDRGAEASLACVPLLAHGRCIGGLTYRYAGARTFDEDERAFLQVLAWHSAQAIERSRLYAAEKRARVAAEASQRRSELLAHAGTLLTSSLDESAILAGVARAAVPRIADWCVVDIPPSEGSAPEGSLVAEHVDPAKTPLVLAMRRHLRAMGDPDWGISMPVEAMRARAGDAFAALFADTDVASTVAVPISARGRTLGSIVVTSTSRPYDDEDVAILGELGRRAGLAVDNARLYREAREGERQKDEFLAMLSHELRNPLAPIVGALDVMKLRGDGAFARERAVIDRHVRHIVRLVDDLLDVARITRGKILLRKEVFEVSHLVAKALEMVSGLVEERGQRLTVNVPERGARVLADETRLTQAIANLLANATKFTGAGGDIRVTGEVAGDEVVVRVKDSGIGIAPEALDRIFGLFVQEKPALDRALGGLGIGLTVVKQLIALHGGSVAAASDGHGHGSEFAVRLPLVPSAPAMDAGEGASAEPSAAPGAARVLVIDDNVDAADMIAAVLEAQGYGVRVAYDGPSALTEADGFEPDVAVVDIGLPGMTGYELAARLRQLPGGATMRLIALTGYGQAHDLECSRQAGFEAHLVKPIDFDGLERVLKSRSRRTTR